MDELEELSDEFYKQLYEKKFISFTRKPVGIGAKIGIELLSDPTEQIKFLRSLPGNCEIIDVTDDVTLPASHLSAFRMHPGAVLVYHGQFLKGGRAYLARARQPNISGLGVLQRPVYTVGLPFPNAVAVTAAAGITLTTNAPSKDKRLMAVEIVFWTSAARVARASGVAYQKNITLYDVYRPAGQATNATSIILNALTNSTASDVVIQRNITIPKEHEYQFIISNLAGNIWMDFFLTYVMES